MKIKIARAKPNLKCEWLASAPCEHDQFYQVTKINEYNIYFDYYFFLPMASAM